jgi:hypothetical protein
MPSGTHPRSRGGCAQPDVSAGEAEQPQAVARQLGQPVVGTGDRLQRQPNDEQQPPTTLAGGVLDLDCGDVGGGAHRGSAFTAAAGTETRAAATGAA